MLVITKELQSSQNYRKKISDCFYEPPLLKNLILDTIQVKMEKEKFFLKQLQGD